MIMITDSMVLFDAFPNTIIAVRRPAAHTAAHKPLDPRAAKIYAFKL